MPLHRHVRRSEMGAAPGGRRGRPKQVWHSNQSATWRAVIVLGRTFDLELTRDGAPRSRADVDRFGNERLRYFSRDCRKGLPRGAGYGLYTLGTCDIFIEHEDVERLRVVDPFRGWSIFRTRNRDCHCPEQSHAETDHGRGQRRISECRVGSDLLGHWPEDVVETALRCRDEAVFLQYQCRAIADALSCFNLRALDNRQSSICNRHSTSRYCGATLSPTRDALL